LTAHLHVQLIADLVFRKGIRHVVFSPGSRSAPFVIAFQEFDAIKKYVIPDERVAGYFALGIAQQLQQPVVLVCTSGTAVLNLAPAICEAYYQCVPLIVITADRPEFAHEKGENQAIYQSGIFANYVYQSIDISSVYTATEKQLLVNVLNGTFQNLGEMNKPIHWNVHIPEPLYEIAAEEVGYYEINNEVKSNEVLEELLNKVMLEWKSNTRILVIIGTHFIDESASAIIRQINQHQNIVFIGEHNSNLSLSGVSQCNLEALFSMAEEDYKHYSPNIVLTVGKLTLSKKLKQFFKKHKPTFHWHLSPTWGEGDSFDALTMALPFNLADFLNKMPVAITADSIYRKRWDTLKQNSFEVTEKYTVNIAYSDFKVYDEIFRQLPDKCNLQLGNSSPVRYAQYFALPQGTKVNSNRGTSGIDGCVSTATGAAIVNEQLTVCIVGDISFLYDSNALWNNYLSPNLHIIIINNGGGNIFRMVDGATSVKNFETFFETPHQLSAKHLASMYELPYYICTSLEELQHALPEFFETSSKTKILEVKTDNVLSAAIHKQYFEFIKNK